jgi:NAD(P)-dependent dehydrogenase (short-subunit alcohol dehydrogenase family)
MKDLAGRKCLVTGAASGIGRSTAIALSRLGARLVLTDIDSKNLKGTADMAQKNGGVVSCQEALDISRYEAVRDFAARVHGECGAMDVVMNIAGIAVWGTVATLRHEHWEKVIAVNLMGPINVIECFVPPMIPAGGGHLVNVSSAAGIIALPWHAAYSASKFGLRGLSEVLRYDLRRYGIGVSVVCPGAVATPLVQTVEILGVDKNHETIKKFTGDFVRRAVTPEKVADLIVDAVRKNRRMVFTSADIRAAYWLKQKLYFVYDLIMRYLNDRMHELVEAAGAKMPDK